MSFVPNSQEDLLTNFLSTIRSTGITYTHRSSKAYAIGSVLAKELDSAYNFFRSNYDSTFLRNASGQFLDATGELFGVKRKKPTKCYTVSTEENLVFYVDDGTFGDINSGVSITIPRGTIVNTVPVIGGQKSLQYVINNTYVLTSGSSSQAIGADALSEGSAYRVGPRSLIAHDFTSYADYSNNTLKVINRYGIVNGEDIETDDSFRFRISTAATALQAGNLTALRFAALSTTGVADLSLIKYFDGIGTVGIFVVGQDNTVSPLLVNAVQSSIDFASSFGIRATVYSPSQVGLSFSTKINTASPLTINAQNELKQKLQSVCRAFITGLTIGDSLNLRNLENDLIQADNRILYLGTVTGSPWDSMGVWRTTWVGTQLERVREEALASSTILIQDHEIFIPESSLSSPFTFTF